MSIAEQVRDLALRLPPEGRATLAKQLIESLETEASCEDAESAWREEIEVRAESLARGEATADDWQISIARVRRALSEARQS